MSTQQKDYLKKGILYSLTAIILFCSGYIIGALTNSVTATIDKPIAAIATVQSTTETTTEPTTTTPTTTAPTTTTTAPTTTEPTTETTTTTTESTTESTTQGENQGTEERVFNCFLIEMKVNALEAIRDLLNIDFVTTVIDTIVSFCMTVDSLFA